MHTQRRLKGSWRSSRRRRPHEGLVHRKLSPPASCGRGNKTSRKIDDDRNASSRTAMRTHAPTRDACGPRCSEPMMIARR